MIDLKLIEKELLEELKGIFIGKEYKGKILPFEIVESTGKIIAEKVFIFLSNINFNIKPICHESILLISVQDDNENTIIDVIYSVDYKNKETIPEFKINNVLVSIKEYPFQKEGLI